MGRRYVAIMDASSVSAAGDLIEIAAPSDAVVRILGAIFTQEASETSEQLDFSISRATTSGSGGSSVTPVALEASDAAFGGTVERNNSTPAGTLTTIHKEAVNMLTGWYYQPIPEAMIHIAPSGIVVFRIDTAPGASLTMDGTVWFEEIG